jgi:hypothetical protein
MDENILKKNIFKSAKSYTNIYILNLESYAAIVIKKTIELMKCKNLQKNVAFISFNFGFLVATISK